MAGNEFLTGQVLDLIEKIMERETRFTVKSQPIVIARFSISLAARTT